MNNGFVGLGVMGFPMAGHLQAAGHSVRVYNRTKDKAIRWVQRYGGELCSTPRDVANDADLVCLCVGNDDDVLEVTMSQDGVLAGLPAGGVIIDHTTASAELARQLSADAAKRGVMFFDAQSQVGRREQKKER